VPLSTTNGAEKQMFGLQTDLRRRRGSDSGISIFSNWAASTRKHTPPRGNKSEWPARTEAEAPLLEVKSVVPHGDLYEIKGSPEPGRTVIFNGEHVRIVFENSSFRYFVGPLHDGITILTIPVQNEYGGVNTKQLAVSREH
jgi:hypothetical protein